MYFKHQQGTSLLDETVAPSPNDIIAAGGTLNINTIRTRTHSRWGAIANPHTKVFDPPAPPSPNPGHKNSVQCVFYLLF